MFPEGNSSTEGNLFLVHVHRYVHLDFPDSKQNVEAKPCSLVICGPAEAQADQCACAFQDAIRMLLLTWEPMEPTSTALERTWPPNESTPLYAVSQRGSLSSLEPGCVIPAGGTFELLLSQALSQHGISRGLPAISNLLADALLSVARQLHSNSPRCFLQIQARLLSSIQTYSHTFSPSFKQEKDSCLPGDSEQRMYCKEVDIAFISNLGLESVCCKYQLLLAVLQCVSSLLQVDAVLHTRTDLHSITHRLANISWEEAESETED